MDQQREQAAERRYRNHLARQALRTFREQVESARRELEAARTAGDAAETKACEMELEAYRTLVYDLERELGPAAHEKDPEQVVAAGGAS